MRFPAAIVTLLLALLPLASTAQRNAAPQGIEKLPDGNYKLESVTIRTAKRELAFPALFVLSEGALEVIVAKPEGRLHETLLVTETSAVKIQTALYLLKARNGARSKDKPNLKQGTLVDIDIEWTDDKGMSRREPIEEWIRDRRTDAPMKRIGWVFTGSGIHQGKFLADSEGNIVINWSQGATVLDSPDPESEDDTLHTVNSAKPQPTLHPDVTVVFRPRL